jgi:GNAT superfamily N-acetyltransferase
MQVTALTEQDLPDLARLYKQFRGEESSPADMSITFHSLESDTNYFLLGVREEGRLVGSVMGILCRELYGRCRRCRRVGSKLMEAVEQEALRFDCSYIMLVTDANRTDALGFYEHLGYHPDRYRACKKYLDTPEQ